MILDRTSKVSDTNQDKWLSCGILEGLAWAFLMLLSVGDDLLQYLFPPGTTQLNIHEYCNSLKFLFDITAFALEVHVLDKYGRKYFYFKHVSMVLAILIIVAFQVLEVFNRSQLPPLPYPKREYEEMEGRTAKEQPAPYPVNSNICIALEIIHRLSGAALVAYYFWNIGAGMILYDRQYP